MRKRSGFTCSCSEVSPAGVLSFLEHAEITFSQGKKQKAMCQHEVTQTHLGNAGPWFEESLTFRSLQGEKVSRKLWKWWQMNDLIKTGIQEHRGGAGCICDPTKCIMRPLTHLCRWSAKRDPGIKVASGPCGPSRLPDRSIHPETTFVWFKCHLWCDQQGIKWSGVVSTASLLLRGKRRSMREYDLWSSCYTRQLQSAKKRLWQHFTFSPFIGSPVLDKRGAERENRHFWESWK